MLVAESDLSVDQRSGGSQAEAALVACPTGGFDVLALEPGPIHLSLVLPSYNESENIVAMLEHLTALLEPTLAGRYEIIVVDDDSPDRTWELAQAAATRHPAVRVMRRQGERGLSTAVIRGWQVARGDVLAVMDADLQHPPELNLKLLAEMDRGADIAVGSRHVSGGGVSDWSVFRRLLSRGAQLVGLLVLPAVLGRLSDPMSGFFMVRRNALVGAKLDPVGYKILVEVVARAQARWIGEVGYVFRERSEGKSKVTSKVYLDYLRHLLRLRWATLPQSRLFRFCIVGASGVVVDMGLLFVLSDPSTLGLGLTRSKLVASQVAILNNFLWNDLWTFKDTAAEAPGFRSRVRRFIAFYFICMAGIAINVVILNVLFNFAGMNRYVANLIAIGVCTGWNYGLNRKLNWAPLVTNSRRPPA